jgi:hypothetical protein
VSTALVRRRSGRPSYAVVTSPEVGQPHGLVFVVLGDHLSDEVDWTGEPTGRPPLPAETPQRRSGGTRESPREWTDEHRAEAHRLAAEGLSQSKIAELVCGDRRFRSTVQLWLKAGGAGSASLGPVRARNMVAAGDARCTS